MNKNITLKKAVLILFILAGLMAFANVYLKAVDSSNREDNLYFELIQLKLPLDTEIVKLKSSQYMFGDVVLQCDFKSASESNLSKKIQAAGWSSFDGKDMQYEKDDIVLIVSKKDDFYSLRLVDCRNFFNGYLYDLPRNLRKSK